MTDQDWLHVARTVFTSRLIDTIEETELAPAGKITYQFSAKGHELPQAICAALLTHPHDAATVYYRSRPFVLGAGMSIRQAFAGPLGTIASRSAGRDIGVVHHLPRGTHGIAVLPASGDVGAQFTPAVGWAQAAVYRADVLKETAWKGACAVAFAGDGATATNGFWAALGIATTQTLPVIFCIEDNGYGISVPSTYQTPGRNIAANLRSFTNLHVIDGDGTQPPEAAACIEEALSMVRQRLKPVLLRLSVPRLCGHSGADNQAYKTSAEREFEVARDPIPRLREFLVQQKICTKATLAELEADVERQVREELKQALADAFPQPSDAVRHVVFDGKIPLRGGMRAEGVQYQPTQNHDIPETTPATEQRVNFIEAVRRVLDEELAMNPRVLVFGEDVGVKGGVHGATVDLQRKYGKERVFDTSLSEEGIIGRAVGMALAGLVPVPEIQFRKYADPATEQLNDCGTIRWRTNGDFAAPIVVRIPVGYGKRTGDPWHSVSGEAVFAHAVGWRIAFPSNARDAAGLLRTALRGDDPTFFLEHRALLDTPQGRAAYPANTGYMIPFGIARNVAGGKRATVITWGEMVYRALEAAERVGGDIDVIDMRTIIPWDKDAVLNSVKKTGRCLVLHEDTHTAGFGGEIAAFVAQECFMWLDAPVQRLASADCPIPYSPYLMEGVVPSVQVIAERLKSLLAF
ncbi:MAG: thiamine pyrophosphate-dependent enzyme [Bacteroidota bacterium]|nr:thiamine pyrophosphate-dependent enzyme [Candidatus Kapabacteria bacterium]MDW8220384.1 thiamine pyrophosphate-dependent enzyme [Bacteroidota bacterium]